jgi:YVTN family beta-propeller protein
MESRQPHTRGGGDLMTAPIHTIVDHVPHTESAFFFQVFDDSLYCSGSEITRVDLATNATTVLADGHHGACSAIVDFHQPIDPPPDISGTSTPDRRIYFAMDDRRVGEIVPALGDRFQRVDMQPSSIACMAATNSGKLLYFHAWDDPFIAIVDLSQPWPVVPKVVGTIQLDSRANTLAVSKDDRFIYAAHSWDETMSMVDTSTWPPTVNVVPVANGPCSLALSADGTRLFVAQCGFVKPTSVTGYGSGSLTVYDTATMQGSWIYTGRSSADVKVNTAGTRAYVSNYEEGTVSVVDTSDGLTVIDTIEGFSSPGRLGLSVDEQRLYVTQFGSGRGIAVVSV